MSWGDVRGLLQYVPQFRGKVFAVVVDSPVPALAETMLDLVSLQNIGVKLVIGSNVHDTEDLLDRAAEVELKYRQSVVSLANPVEAQETLDRGQALIVDMPGENVIPEELVRFAASLSASKLIVLHAHDPDLPLGAVRAAEIAGGQPPLLQAAAAACMAGIPRVHLLDGSNPSSLLSELFSNEGAGAMVYADSYRTVRPLREEDIVELLGMISRSVRSAHLVPRDYAAVAERIGDYSVMEIDGNVVGSVALYRYPEEQTAEVACLYVKQSHEGLGYATELVRHAEKQAKAENIPRVFALTNRASAFFQQLGYRPIPAENIPPARYRQLLDSGRDSMVLEKGGSSGA